MALFKYLPAEILGLSVLAVATLTRMILPEISDFWLALASAIGLFVIMQLRSHLVLDRAAKGKRSP